MEKGKRPREQEFGKSGERGREQGMEGQGIVGDLERGRKMGHEGKRVKGGGSWGMCVEA